MKKIFSITIMAIGWFAVITQYFLMIQNRTVPVAETTIRFFSFFTILTNTIVALYFTVHSFSLKQKFLKVFNRAGILTAITVYITVVGLVYQLLLRHLWTPTGMQMIADELLHSLIPLLVIAYWWKYENGKALSYKQIGKWMLYPLGYLVFVLIRGKYSGFYPYPFVNVTDLGLEKVLVNSFFLTLLFILLSAAAVALARRKK